MSAQPIQQEDPLDPEVILRGLPQAEHPIFLAEYRQAAETASSDPARYKDLRQLLIRWSLVADMLNDPVYAASLADAKAGYRPGLSQQQVDAIRATGP